jgi:hypothetical protein
MFVVVRVLVVVGVLMPVHKRASRLYTLSRHRVRHLSCRRASAGSAHSGYLHLFDPKLMTFEQLEIHAAALTLTKRLRDLELPAASAATRDAGRLDDFQVGPFERRLLRAEIEAETDRFRRDGTELPNLQSDTQNASASSALDTGLDDTLGDAELVHG